MEKKKNEEKEIEIKLHSIAVLAPAYAQAYIVYPAV